MPDRIEDTLLVVASLKHRGTEFRPGDRVPIRHPSIWRLAAKQPELFRLEYATEALDLEWLVGLEAGFEDRYQAVKLAQEEQKARAERALRAELEELEELERAQPELERLYEKQGRS